MNILYCVCLTSLIISLMHNYETIKYTIKCYSCQLLHYTKYECKLFYNNLFPSKCEQTKENAKCTA